MAVNLLPEDEARRLLDRAPLSSLLRPLAERGQMRAWRKGSLLVEEGDSGDTLLIVIDGRVKAFSEARHDLNARDKLREITYGIYSAGDYVGEMSLDGGPRSASVVALEATVCSVVTRQSIRLHIAEHPDFAFELLARVIRRARGATVNARSMALLDVYGRLRALLEDLAVQPAADGGRMIPVRLTHAETASRLGCSREMVSRLLKDLDTGGYIRVDGPGLRLVKPLPQRW
jgi:CRP/FNR family transcriptional regulator, cyclic AMP receptor protein